MVHNNKSQKKRKQIANNEPDFNSSNIEKVVRLHEEC